MNDSHEPSPEFLSHLEWQTRTQLRRRQRFAESPPRANTRFVRLARLAALVLVSLFSGAGVTFGVEHIQESREQEVLLRRNGVRLSLAERRTEAARELAAAARRSFEEGLAPIASLARAEKRVLDLEFEVERLLLDRAELRASRRPVDTSLVAPWVAGRDFVRERLELERMQATRDLERFQQTLKRVERGVAEGIMSQKELDAAQHEFLGVRGQVDRISARLELRKRYVAGELLSHECEQLDRRQEAEYRLRSLDLQVEHLRAELERARRFESMGLAAGESAPLEDRLDVLEVERQLVKLEFELLR